MCEAIARLESTPRTQIRARRSCPILIPVSWAAYLTVISTSLPLLPFELYEVLQQVSALRIGVRLLNLVIVVYLIFQLKQHTLHSGSTVCARVIGAQHD